MLDMHKCISFCLLFFVDCKGSYVSELKRVSGKESRFAATCVFHSVVGGMSWHTNLSVCEFPLKERMILSNEEI